MIKEPFLSKRPSHFYVNPIVKAFIISETLLWSSWNFIFPIIALFVVSRVSGGNVETVAVAYSVYLISRVVSELISGKLLGGATDRLKLGVSVLGMLIVSFAYQGFIFATDLGLLFGIYILIGVGLGISSPAKYSLFSSHLDKAKSPTEWSFYDALSFIGMAIAGVIGGFVARYYGFDVLFLIASGVSLVGVLPYVFIMYEQRK